MRVWRCRLGIALAAVFTVATGCGGSGHTASPLVTTSTSITPSATTASPSTVAPTSTTTTTLPLPVVQQNFRTVLAPFLTEITSDPAPPAGTVYPAATWARIVAAAARSEHLLVSFQWPAQYVDGITTLQNAYLGIVDTVQDANSEAYLLQLYMESSNAVLADMHM
jgi:hypothetical protein